VEGVSLAEIQQWTEADLVGIFDGAWEPAAISTDTRTLVAGELFCALKGPSFEGHEFVAQAFAAGACGAIVERQWAQRGDKNATPGPLLLVDDPLVALGTVARNYRRRFDLPVVAVVGSAGKTTTKEMIAAVLAPRYRVLKTSGTQNNEIGVPQTLLQLTRCHEAVVLELAARKKGDIRYLCEVVAPTVGVLLNIGTAHLEFFGSVEGVAEAKGELLDYLDESSTVLVNEDDCVVAQEVLRTKGRLLGFSLKRESRYRGEGLILDREGRGHFSLQNFSFSLHIPGKHNVYNALAAAAVGDILQVPWSDMQKALSSFQPVAMRSDCLRKNEICVINDSYNANPDSVKAALELLGAMVSEGGRRIAVLGDMLELGPQGPALHADIGRRCAALPVDILLTIGPLSAATAAAAQEGIAPLKQAQHFDDKEQLSQYLASVLQPRDTVLIKASRSIGLEEVVEQIT